jgi:hypothetical protein
LEVAVLIRRAAELFAAVDKKEHKSDHPDDTDGQDYEKVSHPLGALIVEVHFSIESAVFPMVSEHVDGFG